MSVKPTSQVKLVCSVLGVNPRNLSSDSTFGTGHCVHGVFQRARLVATFQTVRIKGRWHCKYRGQWHYW